MGVCVLTFTLAVSVVLVAVAVSLALAVALAVVASLAVSVVLDSETEAWTLAFTLAFTASVILDCDTGPYVTPTLTLIFSVILIRQRRAAHLWPWMNGRDSAG